mgnify:CR=1 FL=1
MQDTRLSVYFVNPIDFKDSIAHGHDHNLFQVASLPAQLHGDHVRLKQILINLVKNALKFTIAGEIKLIVTFDAEHKLLRVHVADNGKGIREED